MWEVQWPHGVNVRDSGASSPDLSPDWGHRVVLGQGTTLTVPYPTRVYKWVPANLMLGGNPVMD